MDVIVKRDNGSVKQAVSFVGQKSRVKQSFKKECDVNQIVARYAKTGILGNPLDIRTPIYGDFSNMPTYRESLDMITKINAEFMRLPAETRARFDNDAGKMLDFIEDDKNLAECVKLGLLSKACLPKDVVAEPESSTSTNVEVNADKPA